MKPSDIENMIREIIQEELQSTLSEEEYDIHQDYKAGGLSWEEYQDALASYRRRHPEETPQYRSPRKRGRSFGNRQYVDSPPRPGAQPAKAPAATPTADKNAMLQQVIKYKDADGTDREATVKSLLGYPKDHPGRKLAARVYAQYMSKARPQPQKEQTNDPYEDPYAQTTPTRLATPRGKRAKWTVTPSGGIEQKPTRPQSPSAPSTPSPSPTAGQGKLPILQRVIKYKKADGTDGEGTIKSLLSYPPEHPGHKAAKAAYMRRETYESPTNEKMCEGEGCLDEKSVPQPYDRKKARKMTRSQIDRRKKIGRSMESNEKTVSKFRKKYGDDWKSYLYAAATSAARRRKGEKSKKKK